MNIKDELTKLSSEDIYSLLLFVLYRCNDIPEYSALSQLTYVLDKNSLLNLCSCFGGLTITIPTISQLQELLEGLLMYQLIDIDKQDLDTIKLKFEATTFKTYTKIKEVLKEYNFKVANKDES